MKIIGDENIPYVREAFMNLGNVITLSGRKITNDVIKDAEILLVRSITPVDEKLLKNSRIKFVATATIGMDHLDIEYLKSNNIGFSNAAGSNANSVAEYIITALLHHACQYQISLKGKFLGIVGVGNIGSKMINYARALGMEVIQNDPPLARVTGAPNFRPLDELMVCDFITLHVPLTIEGIDRTWHLFDEERILKMKPGSVLLNSSRGPVVATDAAKKALYQQHLKSIILDVWENEPEIDLELLKQVEIGTPHIAGYSYDGKINGTRMIYEAACRFFNQQPDWDASEALPAPVPDEIQVPNSNQSDEEILYQVIKQIYDIELDDKNLRRLLEKSVSEQGPYFDHLRKSYRIRREFYNYRLNLPAKKPELKDIFRQLGFKINTVDAK
ncbi:4-phosphoerythronate dehydrogenase [candidate division KSB1 bacterium]|nr:4-phosphoerythronate dehydrogenase [candidate division KSB1 bacterium]